MSIYRAELLWQRGEQVFTDQRYSRRHLLRFDGLEVPGSSSPQVVPLPHSDAQALDPEEAFVASLASCHLLWFLSIAADQGYCVDRYEDPAEGVLARNAQGRFAMTRVTLRPHCWFSGAKQPDAAALSALHHQAHEACFIAQSVKTEVLCEPVLMHSSADQSTAHRADSNADGKPSVTA